MLANIWHHCVRCILYVFTALPFFLLALPATAEVTVNKSFSPTTLYPSQISQMTVELFNSSIIEANNISFNDIFPDTVFVAATPNTVNTCGGTATPNNTATAGSVAFSSGTIPAGDGVIPGSCSISMDIYGTRKGNYIDSIISGDVTGVIDGIPVSNADSAEATLAIIMQDRSY